MEKRVMSNKASEASCIYTYDASDADSLSIGEDQRNGLRGFLCVKQKEAGVSPAFVISHHAPGRNRNRLP